LVFCRIILGRGTFQSKYDWQMVLSVWTGNEEEVKMLCSEHGVVE